MLKLLLIRYDQENGRSLLHRLPRCLNPDQNPQHRQIVDILLEVCADEINEQSKDGLTPIARAIHASSAYITNALVNAGAEILPEHVPPCDDAHGAARVRGGHKEPYCEMF
jgi:ankyrin repeat protein